MRCASCRRRPGWNTWGCTNASTPTHRACCCSRAAWSEQGAGRPFEGRDVRKVYLAFVQNGAPPRAEGAIDARPSPASMVSVTAPPAPAIPAGWPRGTRYRVLDTYSVLRSASSVESHEQRFLRQSRNTQHAIRNTDSRPPFPPPAPCWNSSPKPAARTRFRVQYLAYIGCPVVGDPLYGPADRPAPRLYLHAYQLTVPHPATGRTGDVYRAGAGSVAPGAGGSIEDGSRRRSRFQSSRCPCSRRYRGSCG